MRIETGAIVQLFSEGVEQDQQQALPFADSASERPSFRDNPWQRLARLAQVFSRACSPHTVFALPATIRLFQNQINTKHGILPDPDAALRRPDGLAGLAKNLSVHTLAQAYGRGLHARCLAGPATFWAPAQRLVVHPANLKYNQSLRRIWRKGEVQVTFDRNFDALIALTARDGDAGPRLSPKIVRAHTQLFDAGIAHSFEVWDTHGTMIGGGYGIATGSTFVLERTFAHVADAARFGLSVLARHLVKWGITMLDATFVPELVQGMGFAPLARQEYGLRLGPENRAVHPGSWRIDPAIFAGAPRGTIIARLFAAQIPQSALDPAAQEAMRRDLFESIGLPLEAEIAAAPGNARDAA